MAARKRKPLVPNIPVPTPEDAAPDSAFEDLIKRIQIDASGPSEITAEEAATWVKSSGWTPIEFLTHVYRNQWQKMEHRLNAAKAVLEYAHRKMPAKLEVEGSGGVSVRNIDAAALSKLSPDDLVALETLLEKLA